MELEAGSPHITESDFEDASLDMNDITKLDFREHYDWSEVDKPITDDQAKAWVAALRSKEFEQGEGQLCDGNLYCCLGVANSIFNIGLDGFKGALDYFDSGEEFSHYYLIPGELQHELAELNDTGYGFADIATVIEKGFKLIA